MGPFQGTFNELQRENRLLYLHKNGSSPEQGATMTKTTRSQLPFRTTTAGVLLVALIALFVSTVSCKQGEVIEQIGDHTITTSDYEEYYTTYLEKAARFAHAEKKTLYKLMCNPDQIPSNPILQDMIGRLKPENNYNEYRRMRMIEQVAMEEGFLDKPVVRKIVEQVVLETVVNLYLNEKMDERIKISLEEKQQKCEELRRQYPDRVGSLPLDTCLYIAEGIIKQSIVQREGPVVQEEITESVSIQKNPKFDRNHYLDEGMDIYKTIRKEGGCAVEDSSTPSSSTPVTP